MAPRTSGAGALERSQVALATAGYPTLSSALGVLLRASIPAVASRGDVDRPPRRHGLTVPPEHLPTREDGRMLVLAIEDDPAVPGTASRC